MERDRERDLEKERERDLDPDLEREEREPDLDLFVLDISASTCQCTCLSRLTPCTLLSDFTVSALSIRKSGRKPEMRRKYTFVHALLCCHQR